MNAVLILAFVSTVAFPVVPVEAVNGMWIVPERNVGIAYAGNNTILMGHNPGVFSILINVDQGDELILCKPECITYVVSEIVVLHERGATLEQRLENGRYILPTSDVRLTAVTCLNGKADRLVIVAYPARWHRGIPEGE